MFRVNNQLLSVSLDVIFNAPVPYDSTGLVTIAKAVLEKFATHGLRPNNLSQNSGDQLFNYDLSFSLFNNQAQFKLSAERLLVTIQNARTEADVKTLTDALVRVQQCFSNDMACRTNFQAVAHAAFPNEAEYNVFFAPFADATNDIVDGGRIVFVKEKDWPLKVRLAFERSIVFKNSVFITWWTEQAGMIDIENFKEIADKFGKSLQKTGLEINFGQT
jgi:hypothetical protein